MNTVDALFQKIVDIKGIGDKKNTLFRKINIRKVIDALYYMPTKIEHYLKLKTVNCFTENQNSLNSNKNVILYVTNIKKIFSKNVQCFKGFFEELEIDIVFFNKASAFKIKNEGYIRGVYEFKDNKLKFVHPDFFEKIYYESNNYKSVYNFPKGLFNSDFNKILNLNYDFQEWIPKRYIEQFDLSIWHKAILDMHRIGESRRLAFDEAMFLYGYVLKQNNIAEKSKDTDYNNVLMRAGIKLTLSQQVVVNEIVNDLKKTKPMVRLLHGDVGSGKTIVAMISMLGFLSQQIVILAPTTLLVEQHYNFAKKILSDDIVIKVATSGKSNFSDANLIIGTHVLIEDKVDLSKAKYIIIDEQHKFGVQQRAKLIEKANSPHLLIMSATPIPRTMEKSISGMISVSKITELPFDRKIKTYTVNIDDLQQLVQKVKNAVDAGLTGYWICPAIEENEFMESIETRYAYLYKIFGDDIGVLHGKMKQDEKNQILNDFKNYKYKFLLATTAIETGIDISHARFIVIEHSERFGLAQLHQIRGRIGRNSDESYCFLLHSTKSPVTLNRINVIRDNLDGFKIAEYDLLNRGSGQVYGNMQSGLSFKMFDFLDPVNDSDIIEAAKEIDYDNLENYDQLLRIMKYRKCDLG